MVGAWVRMDMDKEDVDEFMVYFESVKVGLGR